MLQQATKIVNINIDNYYSTSIDVNSTLKYTKVYSDIILSEELWIEETITYIKYIFYVLKYFYICTCVSAFMSEFLLNTTNNDAKRLYEW